jgi:hypothetical protein
MEIREKAIKQLRAATEADKRGDLQVALEMYKAGLSDLLQAIKREF